MRAQGFWRAGREAFFDLRVFYPNTPSYRERTLGNLYRQHELDKKWMYGQQVGDVEQGAFTPLVLATTAGMARECTTFFKRLSSMIADKRRTSYHSVMAWLRCRVSFALLHQSITAMRGTRSAKRNIMIPTDITLATQG